jgi:hypothetical protein
MKSDMIYREQMWYSLGIAFERSASVMNRDEKTIRMKEWDNRNGTQIYGHLTKHLWQKGYC